MKPRLLDLFSGIGGFSIGLERAGFQTVAFCEVEPACRHLLSHHWPEVPCYDDVRTLTAERLAADGIAVDAICGGFPCQDISLAGAGAGIEGERSGLWREYARLIGELRPRLVFVENVSALLGRGMGRVLGDLAALRYDAKWSCIPAAALGAPHRRDRLWIIAYPERNVISRPEPCLWPSGRMGRQQQSFSWDLGWQATLAAIRGVDDGVPRSVDRTDGLRNAVVPQIPELIGKAALEALDWETPQ